MKKQLFIRNSVFLFFSLLFSSCSTPLKGQATEATNQRAVSAVKVKLLTTDKLQQFYLVDPDNEVIKFNAKGKELFRFSNNQLGDLAHLDATDPFNVLLYYPDYLKVLTLDRTLNLTGEFDLQDLGLLYAQAVGMTNDNQLWVYDENVFKLRKVNRSGEILLESNDMSLLLDEAVNPNFLIERDNWVYLNVPSKGILVFDNFGRYAKLIPILTERFDIWKGHLVYQENEKLLAFHLRSLLTKELQGITKLEPGDQVRLQGDLMYVARRKGGVEIFDMSKALKKS